MTTDPLPIASPAPSNSLEIYYTPSSFQTVSNGSAASSIPWYAPPNVYYAASPSQVMENIQSVPPETSRAPRSSFHPLPQPQIWRYTPYIPPAPLPDPMANTYTPVISPHPMRSADNLPKSWDVSPPSLDHSQPYTDADNGLHVSISGTAVAACDQLNDGAATASTPFMVPLPFSPAVEGDRPLDCSGEPSSHSLAPTETVEGLSREGTPVVSPSSCRDPLPSLDLLSATTGRTASLQRSSPGDISMSSTLVPSPPHSRHLSVRFAENAEVSEAPFWSSEFDQRTRGQPQSPPFPSAASQGHSDSPNERTSSSGQRHRSRFEPTYEVAPIPPHITYPVPIPQSSHRFRSGSTQSRSRSSSRRSVQSFSNSSVSGPSVRHQGGLQPEGAGLSHDPHVPIIPSQPIFPPGHRQGQSENPRANPSDSREYGQRAPDMSFDFAPFADPFGASLPQPSPHVHPPPAEGRAAPSQRTQWSRNWGSSYYAPYPDRARAAGLYIGSSYRLPSIRQHNDEAFHSNREPSQPGWKPAWSLFPLRVFRGAEHAIFTIQREWDDADLMREVKKTYDKLRRWRKWFSLKSVRTVTMVLNDHSIIYPQRVGPVRVSSHRNMRLRWFLDHPDSLKGSREFMQVLTQRTDLGIEFVERWQASRIFIAIVLPVAASLLVGVLYSALTNDVSSGFTVAGYMTSAYSVCLVLIGVLNLVEF
ncbi:hypothetical protein AcV7_006832 [Taiwanofungus camphoratus]|nr:hypothetical protein AcV7_006832 [Antrodia cinnamomea]